MEVDGMIRIIRSGTLITASETFDADILIDDEKIVQIGSNLTAPEGAEVIDAAGKLIMPGGVDAHCHFDLPMFGTVSSDDHYTGHKAAAFGGTTTVIDFIPQIRHRCWRTWMPGMPKLTRKPPLILVFI
jgi:dihydropyrimidinase